MSEQPNIKTSVSTKLDNAFSIPNNVTRNSVTSAPTGSLLAAPSNAPANGARLALPNNLAPSGAMLAPVTRAQKLGAGSATGNPRNKCALKPGYSLMGWVRLGNSGEDLAGTKGRVRPVTSEELAKHSRQDDAWMAIRGKVYNVTRYMDYHPGGVDELMRGVGRDATKLFNEVHAWVNYQQLLAKCYIGPLRTVMKIDEDTLGAIAETATDSPFSSNNATTDANTSLIVPRFDWTQKRSDLTIYIYTRQGCNPGCIVRRLCDKTLELRIQIEQTTHLFKFELQDSVKWPPKQLKVAAGGTGKIEITFEKAEVELWSGYGTHTLSKCAETADELQYEFEIMHKADFSHDSFELVLQGSKDTLMWLPVGHHVSITAVVDGDNVCRSYTPVPAKYLSHTTAGDTNCVNLYFLIKSYTDGQLTAHLRSLQTGAILQLSQPRGNFKLAALLPHRRIAFLAAGSGLTPFLQLNEHLLQRHTNRIEQLQLLYFNKSTQDIWCRATLNNLQSTDERFQFVNVLSQATDDWSGLKGRIGKELLAPLADSASTQHVSYIAVCGPIPFNQLAGDLLRELEFDMEHVHIFQG